MSMHPHMLSANDWGDLSATPQETSPCRKSRRTAKGASGKGPCQNRKKMSDYSIFSTLFDIFALCKKCQKSSKSQTSSKSVKKSFGTFRQFSRGTRFPAPSFGGSEKGVRQKGVWQQSDEKSDRSIRKSLGTKKRGSGNVQANVRAKNSRQFEVKGR